MKYLLSSSLLLLLLLVVVVTDAFVIIQKNSIISNQYSTNKLNAISKDRIKGAGGGIPIKPAGDRLLFDPAIEGKLGGTSNLDERLSGGIRYQYLAPQAVVSSDVPVEEILPKELVDTQHWLEDIGIPAPFAKATQPVSATVLGRGKLISDEAPGDIEHIVLQLPDGMHYIEGQSLSVIPPGIDIKTGKPYKPRLYSIASTRYGDLLDGNTVSLCVRRAEYIDPITGVADPTKKGICSNYLCDCNPGDIVQVAGPVGKTMLLPDDLTKDIIMVATGTGIAPFRAFLHRLFIENTVAKHMYTGNAWLILGVPVTGGLLYPNEIEKMKSNSNNNNLEVTYAISREMKNVNGGKMYVQDVLTERAQELFQRLDDGAIIYFCGLKGMMPGILNALETVAKQQNIDWDTKLRQLKTNGQWHVEVY